MHRISRLIALATLLLAAGKPTDAAAGAAAMAELRLDEAM